MFYAQSTSVVISGWLKDRENSVKLLPKTEILILMDYVCRFSYVWKLVCVCVGGFTMTEDTIQHSILVKRFDQDEIPCGDVPWSKIPHVESSQPRSQSSTVTEYPLCLPQPLVTQPSPTSWIWSAAVWMAGYATINSACGTVLNSSEQTSHSALNNFGWLSELLEVQKSETRMTASDLT